MYAISWNRDQRVGHIEDLQDYLMESLQKSSKNEPQDWVLIGIFDVEKEADYELAKFCLRMEKFGKGKGDESYLNFVYNTTKKIIKNLKIESYQTFLKIGNLQKTIKEVK